MTKYIIIALIVLIIITTIIVLLTTPRSQPEPQPSSLPTVSTRPVGSQIPNPSVTFATPIPSSQIDEYQSQTDKEYADQVREQDEQYPWLQSLPLQTPNYFVYFDTSTNEFTAEIYNTSQEQQLRQEILSRLQALNINTADYTINWQIK